MDPAAAERAIRAYRCTRRTLTSYGQVILGRKQLTISIEHVSEADDTGGIRLFGAVAYALQFGDFSKDFIAAILRLDEQTEGVFHIFGRVKDGASILEQGFCIGASRLFHFRSDSAEIEESPAQTYYS